MKRVSVIFRTLLCVVLLGALLGATAMPALAVVPSSSTIAPAGGTVYIVNCSALNLRSNASVTSSVYRTLARGTQVTYLGNSNGWWRVNTPYGIGWVDKKYLAPLSTNASTGTYTVTVEKLNVRAYPRLTAKRVTTLTKGQTLSISELNGAWGYSPTVQGWVALAYLRRNAGTTTGSTGVSSVSASGTYTVICTALNVRSGPSTSSSKVGTLKKGQSVTVISVNGNWAQIGVGRWIYWKGYLG